jgi:hypothetical protein
MKKKNAFRYDLTCDLVDVEYFLKNDKLAEANADKIVAKIKKLIKDKQITDKEKFNYLKSEILKEPLVFIKPLQFFLKEYIRFVVFDTLRKLYAKGCETAWSLRYGLATDEDIKKDIKKLEKRRKRWFNWFKKRIL